MDFDEYVAARHSTLLRTAVLLGCPPAEAPAVVRRVLTASARRISRAEDPDPLVYDALVAAVPGAGVSEFAALDTARRYDALMAAPAVDPGTDPAVDPGDTIGAGATLPTLSPAPPSGPPPWQLFPAIAALVGLLLAAALVGPGAAPQNGPAELLGGNQVPSLFGYDEKAAADLLRDRGLLVVEEPTRACELNGRVLSTDPPAGSPVRRGSRVALRTAVPSGASCDAEYASRALAWRLVDFATDRGPAPRFAPQVRLLVVGADALVLTRAQAERRRAWGRRSALVALADATSQVVRDGASYVVPQLTVYGGPVGDVLCGSPRPFFADDRPAITFTIGLPGEDIDRDSASSCPLTISLYRTAGAIDAVVLYAPTAPGI